MSPSIVAVTERSCIFLCWAATAIPAVKQLAKPTNYILNRRGAFVFRGEDFRLVGVKGERLFVQLFLAEAIIAFDCRVAVSAILPFAYLARVPGFAARVPRSITTLTAQEYRNPDQLPDGGVLVVGASSSGTQIGYEIQRSGHPVILSVGEHIRAPRVYRGKDLEW